MISMKDLIKKQTDTIREETGMNINEYTPTSDEVGSILVDLFSELSNNVKKLNKVKIEKWGKKYHKSASKLVDIIRALNMHITRIR